MHFTCKISFRFHDSSFKSMNIDVFNNFYKGKKVLVTGHTGFKGSWLSIWLHELGAEVVGVGLEPYSEKDNFVLSGIGKKIKADIRADIRDGKKMKKIFQQYQPEIVFHLAAQPLVRLSYEIPVETYQTNVMGTINIMEAIRATESVKVGVMITTDKCYDNKEQMRGYKEDDPFGGYDPYSSSKGACEIAIQSWRRSFFNPEDYGKKHHVSLASVRAGNVIGGGDWAKDRIIPDCIRALEAGNPIEIRSPKAVRPWEHVLEPLSGYMLLAQKMWEKPTEYCEGWNFGPEADSISTVWEVATELVNNFGKGELKDISDPNALHEANLLMLNIEKAKSRLGWKPTLDSKQTMTLVADWYKKYRDEDVYGLCVSEIQQFIRR
ncbi:CDP-glucose 4,6-dehydratase [Xylanibacter ruminicola]|uniref:CDP-glucose 4,6-dehydratase n=2 Tax=Xylanibacter ruminicola TaxID=839 RepID=A0A1M6R7W7_XYLRU|nr:CDP-glucose 4,6-dehydratase [Xylanibacter ruminicola]